MVTCEVSEEDIHQRKEYDCVLTQMNDVYSHNNDEKDRREEFNCNMEWVDAVIISDFGISCDNHDDSNKGTGNILGPNKKQKITQYDYCFKKSQFNFNNQ